MSNIQGPASGAQTSNNLSDLTNAATARTNLGMGTAGSAVTPGSNVVITVDNTPYKSYAWTAGENESVTISGTHSAGQMISLRILNDGTLPRMITLSTGFIVASTIVGTASKTAIILLISNGTSFYELARTLLLA